MRTRFTQLAKGLNRKRGEMNKTEKAYELVLNQLWASGDICDWKFEPLSFRLSNPPAGQPARYTPDFMVVRTDGEVWFVDVKTSSGFDDKASLVRIKCCAEQYQLFRFFVARQRKKSDGGGFELTEV